MFLRNLTKHLKEGMDVVVQMFGIEYEGKIISLDLGNPQDAGMLIENEDGTRHLIPVNVNSCISFVMEDEEETEEESYKTYDQMDIPELRKLCDDRGIDYGANSKRRGLVNLLKYGDEQKEKVEVKKKKKKIKVKRDSK